MSQTDQGKIIQTYKNPRYVSDIPGMYIIFNPAKLKTPSL